LELRIWGFFKVADITQIAYNDRAFHGLVLRENKKKLISSLLRPQECNQGDDYDDLIQGKGKGLIFLLHGPPGVGKTYTAGSYCSANIKVGMV
jgi:ATP-dependent Lon protease